MTDGVLRTDWPVMPVERWSNALHGVCGRFNAIPAARDGRVQGAVALRHAGRLEVADVAADLAEVNRTERDASADHARHYFLIFQAAGSSRFEQCGRSAVTQPGDCVLIDSAQASRFAFDGAPVRHVSVHIPRSLLHPPRAPAPGLCRTLDVADPMAGVLRGLLAKFGQMPASAPLQTRLLDSFVNALHVAFADDAPLPAPPEATLLARAEALIAQLLDEPDLDTEQLAARLDVSPRRLRDAFTAYGHTCKATIREARLQRVADLLRGTAHDSRTICELALACGFNDISFFNRAFRARYGQTPQAMRTAARHG